MRRCRTLLARAERGASGTPPSGRSSYLPAGLQFSPWVRGERAAQYFRIRSATARRCSLGHRALAPPVRLDRLLPAAPGGRAAAPSIASMARWMATSWLLSERSSLRNASRIPLLDIVTCSLEGDPPPHRAGRHSASTRAHRPKHQRGSQEVLRDRSRRSLTRPVVAPTWCVKSGSRRGFPTSPPASPPAPGAGCGPYHDCMAWLRAGSIPGGARPARHCRRRHAGRGDVERRALGHRGGVERTGKLGRTTITCSTSRPSTRSSHRPRSGEGPRS